jgi:hypothetical protein
MGRHGGIVGARKLGGFGVEQGKGEKRGIFTAHRRGIFSRIYGHKLQIFAL